MAAISLTEAFADLGRKAADKLSELVAQATDVEHAVRISKAMMLFAFECGTAVATGTAVYLTAQVLDGNETSIKSRSSSGSVTRSGPVTYAGVERIISENFAKFLSGNQAQRPNAPEILPGARPGIDSGRRNMGEPGPIVIEEAEIDEDMKRQDEEEKQLKEEKEAVIRCVRE